MRIFQKFFFCVVFWKVDITLNIINKVFFFLNEISNLLVKIPVSQYNTFIMEEQF